MNSNENNKAKELFVNYRGSFFHMQREGEYVEYKSFNVPKELELKWKEELVTNLYNELSVDDNMALSDLKIIATSFGDSSVLEKILTFASININKFDSFIKLIYAEAIINIVDSFIKNKRVYQRKELKDALEIAVQIIKNVLDNPVYIKPEHLNLFSELSNDGYIVSRAKKDLSEIKDIKVK